MKNIQADIKSGNFKQVYLLYGAAVYFVTVMSSITPVTIVPKLMHSHLLPINSLFTSVVFIVVLH